MVERSKARTSTSTLRRCDRLVPVVVTISDSYLFAQLRVGAISKPRSWETIARPELISGPTPPELEQFGQGTASIRRCGEAKGMIPPRDMFAAAGQLSVAG